MSYRFKSNSILARLSGHVAVMAAMAVWPAAAQSSAMAGPAQQTNIEAKEERTAIVIASKAVLQAKPSAEAEVVLPVSRDTQFKVTGSTEGWVKVALKGGGEGWLPEAEVGLKIDHAGRACVEVSLDRALDLGAVD